MDVADTFFGGLSEIVVIGALMMCAVIHCYIMMTVM
jgi:hypothetical protein